MRSAIIVATVTAATMASAIPSSHAQDPSAGERIFAQQCRGCHQVGENARSTIGPHLNGLLGRKAGAIAGYTYSPANKNSDIVWDKDTFRDFIKAPKAKMPGTKMVYAGLPDEKRIDDLVAYLRQFDTTGRKVAVLSRRPTAAGSQPRAGIWSGPGSAPLNE